MLKVETYWYRSGLSYVDTHNTYSEAMFGNCMAIAFRSPSTIHEIYNDIHRRVTYFTNNGDPIVTKTILANND